MKEQTMKEQTMEDPIVEVIEQSYEILKYSDDAEIDIEIAARTCYKSEERITSTSAAALVRSLRMHKHFPMIEFGDATVRFITNRGVTHEIVRHRHCSFAQESTRFVNYSKKPMQFILPVWWNNLR